MQASSEPGARMVLVLLDNPFDSRELIPGEG